MTDLRKYKPLLVGAVLLVALVRWIGTQMAQAAPPTFSDRRLADGHVVIGGLDFAPCMIGPAGQGPRAVARCASLDVAEDPSRPQGRHLKLAVSLLPSRSLAPTAHPVVFIAGGPGQAASETFQSLGDTLRRLNDTHDVVLLDARGTGRSEPAACAASPRLAHAIAWGDAAAAREATEACRRELEPRADLTRYGTQEAVADLEALRVALRAPTLNLVAVSYGTRVAQHYMQAHGEHVGSAVLDSVVPNDIVLGADFAPAIAAAVDRRLDACASDAACLRAVGDPRLLLQALRAKVDAAPASPGASGAINPAVLVQGLRELAMNGDRAALLPLAVKQAAAGDDRILRTMAQQEERALSGLSWLAYLSTTCRETGPALAQLAPAADRAQAAFRALLAAQCSAWPTAPAPDPSASRPLATDTPLLLLAGELDPMTPAAWARRVAATSGYSRVVVARGEGHNVIARGCMPRLVEDFIDRRNLVTLDARCADVSSAPAVFLSENGGAP